MRLPSFLRITLLPLVVAASGRSQNPDTAPFEGTWLGEVTAPQGAAAIGFAFARRGEELLTTFYMPDMFLPGVALGPAREEGDALSFAPLDTRLTRDGDRLVGTFGRSHLPVELRRADRFPAPPPPILFPAGPAPRWTASLDAEIWASAVAFGNTIYIGTAAGSFHALAAGDGTPRWTWSGPNALYGTALVTADRIFVLDARTELICLDRTTGRLAWRTRLHDARRGGPLPENETFNRRTAVPILVDDTLYCGSTDGGLYALDPASGEVRFRHDARTKIVSAPSVDGGRLFLGGLDGGVVVFDLRSRREIARTTLSGAISSTPVPAGDILVVGCRDYTLYGLKRGDLSIAWTFSFWFSWVESAPAVVDGLAYIGGSDFARVTALDPHTGRPRWSTATGGLTWGTPLVTEDAVFAGTSAQRDAIIPHRGGIVALDRKTGAPLWRVDAPLATGAARAGFLGSLVLAGGHVVGARFDGTLVALPAAPGAE